MPEIDEAFVDPTAAALMRSMAAMLPANRDAIEALGLLAAATYSRVVAFERVYACPVCGLTTTSWDEMAQHRAETTHACSTCEVCGGFDGQHAKVGCAGGFDGPIWVEEDFVVPRAEFKAPATRQFKCPRCPSKYFASVAAAVAHTAGAHGIGSTAVTAVFRHAARRHIAGYDRGLEPWVPGQPKRRGRLLYQCPDCRYLFSSWSQWEHHVRVTKHSQPFCCECGKIIGKFATDTMNHTIQTGHTRVVGLQPSKESHLRLVDADNPRYDALIDNPDAQGRSPGNLIRYVHQCPDETCSRMFMHKEGLEEHLRSTDHGAVYCVISRRTVPALDIASHPHAIPDLPPSMWFLRDPAEACVVEATEATLLAYYPDDVARCPECTIVISAGELAAHVGSDACIATRGLRAAGWEHYERHKATKTGASPPARADGAPREPDFRRFAQSAIMSGAKVPGAPQAAAAAKAPSGPSAPAVGFKMPPVPPGGWYAMTQHHHFHHHHHHQHQHHQHQHQQQHLQGHPQQIPPSAAGGAPSWLSAPPGFALAPGQTVPLQPPPPQHTGQGVPQPPRVVL